MNVGADEAYQPLRKRYPEIFQTPAGTLDTPEALIWLGELLQKAWVAASDRDRDWYLHDAEALYHVETGAFAEPPPQPSALEQVLLHFRRNLRRALLCRNPRCQTPYFFAQKKGQKFCSKKCSDLATKAAKLRWWNDNRAKAAQPTQPTQTTQPKKKGKS